MRFPFSHCLGGLIWGGGTWWNQAPCSCSAALLLGHKSLDAIDSHDLVMYSDLTIVAGFLIPYIQTVTQTHLQTHLKNDGTMERKNFCWQDARRTASNSINSYNSELFSSKFFKCVEFLHDSLSWSEFQCGDQSTWVDLLNCQAGCLWHVAWNTSPTQWMPEISKYPRLKVNSWAFSVTTNWIPSLGFLILMILSRLSRYRISRSEYRTTTSIALWKPDQFSKYRKGPSARNYSTLQLLRILRIRRLAFLFNIDLFFLPYQACCAATDMEMPWNAIIWGGPCND